MAKVVQSLVAHEGKYIVMPPHKAGHVGWGNLFEPDVCLAGGDSPAEYPVNAKFVDFDRTFIYGYVVGETSAASLKANIGLMNSAIKETVSVGAVSGVIGDTLIGVDGLDVDTGATANEFAGGYVMFRVNPYSDYRIVSSTAYNGGRIATEMDLVLSNGLTAAVVADTANCYLDKNPYQMLQGRWGAENSYESVMGVTLIDPTVSTFQWIQTWGPVHMPSDELLGAADSVRDAYFNSDGSIIAASGADKCQRAGYAIGDTNVASPAATWFIQLQLER